MIDRYRVYAPNLTNQKENFAEGHRACQGCAEALAVRHVLKALGDDIVIANATGCMEIVSSPLPLTSWNVPWIHVAFENAAAVASGMNAGLKALMRKGRIPKKRIISVGMAGDGGTSDIGLQALSGALERQHKDFMYVCFDNEAYMNTGIQRSSSTPFGAATTTSPSGSKSIGQATWKKNMSRIAAAHNIPYVATACSSYPFDLQEKVKKAVALGGPSYIHVLSVCPTGWRIPSHLAIKYGRLAVATGVFPLYEVVHGKYRMTAHIDEKSEKRRPVVDYMKGQGRYRHLSEEHIEEIQKRVDKEYEELVKLTEL